MLDTNFWHVKWETNDIGFHQPEANPLLVKHFRALSLAKGSRIFLPLCGKTLDISWLLSMGFRVAGVELSKLAVEQLFTEIGVQPEISRVGKLDRYRAGNIDIFAGDVFYLSRKIIGPVDAVYDRAALVALPAKTRRDYAAHMTKITNRAPQLLVCYQYDQSAMDGPPFSIGDEEINQHYAKLYGIKLLDVSDVSGGLKGVCEAKEKVWLLNK
jgi:thiopurine S-methyltransferase